MSVKGAPSTPSLSSFKRRLREPIPRNNSAMPRLEEIYGLPDPDYGPNTPNNEVVEPKFSPLTHCALCGKMFPSIAVSVKNQVPLDFTINHTSYWCEPICNCLPLRG
jgi:hypothetical protein